MYRHFRYIWCIQLEEDFLDEADACLKNIAHSRVQQWREREDPAYIMSVMHSSAASRVTSSGPHVSIYDEVYLLLVWFMDHNNSGLIEIFVWWWSLPLIHLIFIQKGFWNFLILYEKCCVTSRDSLTSHKRLLLLLFWIGWCIIMRAKHQHTQEEDGVIAHHPAATGRSLLPVLSAWILF